jgi:uncharacterized OsmC-like protein
MTTAPVPVREFSVAAQSTDTVGRVHCSAREHHFIVDGPKYNNCPGEELTPPELFLVAVASCAVELVQVIAREQGGVPPSLQVRARGTVDRSKQKRADVTVFNSVQLDFQVSGDAGEAARLVEGFRRR